MNLLITGGAGFIGSNLVRYWLHKHPQDQVTVLDKLTYAGNPANLADVSEAVRFVRGDICDAAAVDEAMTGQDAVMHLAAETHVDRSITGPDAFIRTNIVGTHELLKGARRHRIGRFHHVSTDEVFGSLPLDSVRKWSEDAPYDPHSPYSASKAASDHLVRAYHATYGLPVTISNCANNYGPYLYPEKFIALAITNLMTGGTVPLYRPGNQVREWLYVEDHCSALDAIVSRGTVGETYFVGPEEPDITNLELARVLVRMMDLPEERIAMVADRPGHDLRYGLDCTKIRTELGWRPTLTLRDGLATTVAWYRDHRDWWEPIRSGEFRQYYERQYA